MNNLVLKCCVVKVEEWVVQIVDGVCKKVEVQVKKFGDCVGEVLVSGK